MALTVKELLHDAIFYDEPLMAHAVYYAVQRGLVQLDDLESKIPFGDLDFEAVYKMRDENWLQMCTVKLFIIPFGTKQFACYLANEEEDARAMHHTIYGTRAPRVIDASDKMDTTIYFQETRLLLSFREIKRQAVRFPYFVGEM